MFENGGQSLGFQVPRLLSPDFINGLVHMHCDMETIQNMNRLAGFLGNDFQIWLPHVRTNEKQLCRSLFAECPEKPEQRFDSPILANPEKPFTVIVDLIHKW